MRIVYYSGTTEYTKKFVDKVQEDAIRIPIKYNGEALVEEPYVLITPSYLTTKRAVPPQVVKFLNNEENRQHIQGVIGTGNINFNKDYCIAAQIVSQKCNVPLLYRLEITGTPTDVQKVSQILKKLDNEIITEDR